MSRFVHPETTVLTLANGDTLVVKTQLNVGETRAMTRAMASPNGDGSPRFDRNKYPAELVLAYLVDWSLVDAGRPVPLRDQDVDVRRATMDNLFPEDFLEIFRAIETHVGQQDAARAEEKKASLARLDRHRSRPRPPVRLALRMDRRARS